MNQTLILIGKTREYLDYVERHILNVEIAWKSVMIRCKDMDFMSNENIVSLIEADVNSHDLSKLSKEEFTPYRVRFYPAEWEGKNRDEFSAAWQNHLDNNTHHWQSWTKRIDSMSEDEIIACIVANAIDWIAMGFEFADDARDYYEKNKDKIEIPEWAEKFLYQIFDRVYS